jgi:sugar lactone lactonase YvrE
MRSTSGLVVGAAAVLALGFVAACDDSSNNVVCTAGNICTFAGTGEPAFNGDRIDRRQSALYWPMDLEFSPDGRPYVLDWQNHRVRRVNGDDTFETVIGTDEVGDGPTVNPNSERLAPGVPGISVNLNHPTDVVFAPDGTLFLAAWHNHKIRKLDPATGLCDVTCGAGPGYAPPGDDVPAATALMNQPKALAIDPASGALYLVDARNLRVRRIGTDQAATIETVAGTGARGADGDGGSPLAATFSFQVPGDDNPEPGGGLAIDAQGRLYVVDTLNQRIRRIDFTQDLIETVAGNGTAGFSGDGGPATAASLNFPRDAEIGPDGRLYIADTDNHRVRAVDLATGVITTVAGNGNPGFFGDGAPAANAMLHRPFGIAFDAAGSLYIADTFNNRIRKVQK